MDVKIIEVATGREKQKDARAHTGAEIGLDRPFLLCYNKLGPNLTVEERPV